MAATAVDPTREDQGFGPWWLFLITGISWAIIAFVLLALKPGSAVLIGYLVAIVLIFAGINELVTLGYFEGWKWLRITFGVLCIIAGIAALLAPFQTFGMLALIIGWYLLFKGLFSVIMSIAMHAELHLWGLLLAAGILEMVIGVWAIGYPGRSAWLLIIWIGIGALFRGVTEIVTAFQVKGGRHNPPLAAA
jgi:uncharacterized membrane protein HdeD (DUF308 family)